MVLLKDIAFWTVIIVLQLASGYQVAKISFEIKNKWEDKNFGAGIEKSAWFRMLFFPYSATNKLNGLETGVQQYIFRNIPDGLYIFIHMFFWEIRIAINVIDIIIKFVILPIIALAITIVSRVIQSVFALFKTALSA